MSNPVESQQLNPEREPSMIKRAAAFGLGGFILSIYTNATTGNFPLLSLNEDVTIGTITVGSILVGGSTAYFERRRQRRESSEQERAETISHMEALQDSFVTTKDIQEGLVSLELLANRSVLENASNPAASPESD